MFKNFKSVLSKTLSSPSKSEEPSKINTDSQSPQPEGISGKITKVSSFVDEKVSKAQNEIGIIKTKLQNLRQTNYELGLKHIENGNVSDAIFRFRFIKKFWPDLLDAQYQLAYCLVLKRKLPEAAKVLEELLRKNPNFDPKARELLERINSSF